VMHAGIASEVHPASPPESTASGINILRT